MSNLISIMWNVIYIYIYICIFAWHSALAVPGKLHRAQLQLQIVIDTNAISELIHPFPIHIYIYIYTHIHSITFRVWYTYQMDVRALLDCPHIPRVQNGVNWQGDTLKKKEQTNESTEGEVYVTHTWHIIMQTMIDEWIWNSIYLMLLFTTIHHLAYLCFLNTFRHMCLCKSTHW